MDSERDHGEIMQLSARLRLFAQLQGAYMDVLREQGFDDDQAFQLIRDWSTRGFEWTLRPTVAAFLPELPGRPGQPPSHDAARLDDPSSAAPDEPYLLAIDELERELRLLDEEPGVDESAA